MFMEKLVTQFIEGYIAQLPASKRGTDGLLDEFEGGSGGCVIETALKGAVHYSVGKINVHVKRAVIAGFFSRLLAFEFSKGANFKPVISNCLDPLDGAGTAGFLDERYRLSRLLHQIVLKCVAHLIFSWRIAMRVKNDADSDRYYN
jgi:hypothetical protein